MDSDRFWAIVEQTDSPDALHDLLDGLTGVELRAFELEHARVMSGSLPVRLPRLARRHGLA